MAFLDLSAFSFLALLPVVAILYMLKLRRTRTTVPSLLLWSRMVEDFRANTPFQRLRKNLLLLLQLLALLLVILALAQPVWRTQGMAGNKIVLIVDSSLSMKARDGDGGSRFAEALQKAQQTVANMGVGDEMAILEAGPQAQVLAAFSADTAILKQTLGQLAAKDGPGRLKEAMVLALALLKGKQNSHVFVASDGGTEALTDVALGSTTIHLLKVGRDNFNIALTSARLKRSPRSPRDFQLFVGIHNHSDRDHTMPLTVRHGGVTMRSQDVTVKANSDAMVLYDDLADVTGPVEVRIAPKDLLAEDDVTLCLPPASNQRKVALIGTPNPYVRLPFTLLPNVRLAEFPTPPATLTPLLDAHWVVYSETQPDPAVLGPDRRILALAPPSLPGWWDRGDSAGDSVFLRAEIQHPFFQHLRLQQVQVFESHRYALKRSGTTLAEGTAGPWLHWLPAGPESGIALLTFPPARSNLPLLPAWPILLANLLHDHAGANEKLGYVCGQNLEFPARGVTAAELLRPDGTVTKLAAEQDVFRITDAWQSGLYRLRIAGRPDQVLIFSALLPGESDISPRKTLTTAEGDQSLAQEAITTNRDLHVLFVLIALIVVCIEGWLFHQRRVEFA